MNQIKSGDFAALKKIAESRGVYLPGTINSLAFDSDPQPQMPTNVGLSDIVTTYIDPQVVKQIFAPLTATELLREEKRGSWADNTIMINRVEPSMLVEAYGDYSESGYVNINTNSEIRQAYRFQTMVQYGDLEQEAYGKSMIAYAAAKQNAGIQAINTEMNQFYFNGVEGLQNYGILNDPALSTPIAPTTAPGGEVTWEEKKGAVGYIYEDILALFQKLIAQTDGSIGNAIDMNSKLVLAMSPSSSTWFKRANDVVNNTVEKMVRENFPNMRFVVAPQYKTAAGNVVQMFCEEALGETSGFTCYGEKLRMHPVVAQTSSWKQKMSASTYGAVITRPAFFVQMIGV